MIPNSFKAFFVDKDFKTSIRHLPINFLPEHEVTIQVSYSSLNYKDALSARGLNQVTKSYPHIPGIDAVGTVISDKSGTFKENELVVVTGNDMGTNTFGGFANIIRVPSSWVIKVPLGMTPIDTMIMGTAGFTALYGIHRLQTENIVPNSGSVLVTGATGGVGSFAVFALSKLGYQVIAATLKTDSADFLFRLGATKVISSNELIPEKKRPLHPRKWAGCIETVGGELLASVLTQIQPKGAVACCGNVLGIKLSTNILPFILRGIALLGIDSAFCIRKIRENIWEQAAQLNFGTLPENYYKVVSLDSLDHEITAILKGGQQGRVLIEHK